MRLRTFAIFAASTAFVVVAGACSGGDDEATSTPGPAATPTAAPTATPLAQLPEPVIVVGDGVPGGGSGTATEEAVVYTVEAGDTLSGIAERFGVTVELIQTANGMTGVDIAIGQELTIPRRETATATPTPAPGATSTPGGGAVGGDTYVVEEGDTAFGIALQFDITVAQLAAANGVSEDEIANLQIGQVLQIPRQ